MRYAYFAEGIWFLYTSKSSQSHNEGAIIKLTNGYWRSMDDLRILTTTPTVGRKTTREFFAGQAPFGDRTGWRMHEYWAEQVAGQGNNKSKVIISICIKCCVCWFARGLVAFTIYLTAWCAGQQRFV